MIFSELYDQTISPAIIAANPIAHDEKSFDNLALTNQYFNFLLFMVFVFADPMGAKSILVQIIAYMGILLRDCTKEQKIWFEEAVLKMLKETWDHPLIAEHENLLEEVKNLV